MKDIIVGLKVVICLAIFLLAIPLATFAIDQPYNAGFVSGVWFSKNPFFAGETIRVYTAFQNHSGGDITGIVEFFDNEKSIGQTNFSALNDRLVETWIDWKIDYGSHSVSAKITETQRSEAGKSMEKIEVLSSESKPETIFAENTPLPSVPKVEQPQIEVVVQTISNMSSTFGKNIISAIDNFVPYSPPTPEEPKEQTIDSFTKNLLQTVDVQRQKIKSSIQNVDEEYEKIDASTLTSNSFSSTDAVNKIPLSNKTWLYARLAILSLLALVLQNKLILYLSIVVLAYLIFKIIRRVFQK